jgi:hypothetical protein
MISLGHILNILSTLFKKYNLVIQVKKKWKLETCVLIWLKDYFKTFLEHFYIMKCISCKNKNKSAHQEMAFIQISFLTCNFSKGQHERVSCDPPIIWQCSIHYRKLMLQGARPHNLYVYTNFKPTLLYVSSIAYVLSKKLNSILCI